MQASAIFIMTNSKIIYLAINLPASQERRDNLKIQEERCGIHIGLVEAVSGTTLTEEQKAMYDKDKRMSMYPKHMTANEQACVHSHRKAMQTFLDTPAEYGVIMEDDVDLVNGFADGVRYIVEKIGGWECCKLYNVPCKLYDILDVPEAAPVKPIFPRNNSCGAVCYMYTRKAAEKILSHTKKFYMEADPLIAKVLMDCRIPTFGTSPNLAYTIDPHHEMSDIDKDESRQNEQKVKRTLSQYIRYRWRKMSFSRGKWRMLKLLRRSLYIK